MKLLMRKKLMTIKNRYLTLQRNQQGSLIILALIIIFAMSAIGLAVAQSVFVQYGSMKQRLHVENALGAAEAGVSATKHQLGLNNAFTGYADTSRQVLYNDSTRGKADYSTVVTNNADSTKTIVSTGYVYRPNETTAYNTKRVKVIVKAGLQTITTPSVFAGAGGFSVANGAVGPDNASNIINVTGKLYLSNHGVIGGSPLSGATGTPTVNVANKACSQSGNYPVACPSNQQPLVMSGYGRIYGNVCATNQVDQYTAPFGLEGVFPPGTLYPNCTAPISSMPVFDKQAFVNGMTSSGAASEASCSGLGNNKTWQANRQYTGNVSVSFFCSATVTGNTYITGGLTVDGNTTFRVQDGVTTPPVIVVNGKVTMGGLIRVNNLGVGVRIISFHSNNSTCSNSSSCVALSAADAQTSASIRAFDCTFCNPDGSVIWSYFGKTYLGGPAASLSGSLVGLGALIGASVELSQYQYNFSSTWMSAPPGTVTVPGGFNTLDYQQIY